MTSVVLKTEAQKTLVCDSMEISLTIKCEGLSMQASLHRLQECSDQLMASMENAGIDPNSFSLCDIDSAAQDNPPKQRAMAKLKVRGRFDHEQLCRLWQIITAASFPVEISLSSSCDKTEETFAALEDEALRMASKRASAMGAQLGEANVSCREIEFERAEDGAGNGGLIACEDKPAEEIVSGYLAFAARPYKTLCVKAQSRWELNNE